MATVETATLRAFHGDPKVKRKYLARVRRHRKADQLIQGQGWVPETHKGCAVGCTLDAYDHDRYPIELGLPVQLAHAEDHIFERLPKAEAMAWPEAFLKAIPVGADTSQVVDRVTLWTLEWDLAHPVEPPYPEGIARHEALIVLFKRRLAGDEPKASEWQKIERAAWAAWAARAAFYIELSAAILEILRACPVVEG